MRPYTVTMQLLSQPEVASRNKIVYTAESYSKALDSVKELPVILITYRPLQEPSYNFNVLNTDTIIGVARNIQYSEETKHTFLDVTFTDNTIISYLQERNINDYRIGMSYLANPLPDGTFEIERILRFDLYNKDWKLVRIEDDKVYE